MGRGANEKDKQYFGPSCLPILKKAVFDLSWLLSENYSEHAALQLVGDRFQLTDRQRMAIKRCSCSEFDLKKRKEQEKKRLGKYIVIDGFNLLITLEVALAGGVLLKGRDHCLRDLAGIHGSYRQVAQTQKALTHLGNFLQDEAVKSCLFYFDRRISNSGKTKKLVEQIGRLNGWDWSVELVDNCDAVLVQSTQIVATSDSQILNHISKWYNLAARVVGAKIPLAWIIDLSLDVF